jgi:hypothetical protein
MKSTRDIMQNMFKKGVSYGTAGALYGATTGALNGATGAAILKAAGYAGYSILEVTQVGAVGNAVIAGSAGLLKGLFHKEDNTTFEEKSAKFTCRDAVTASAISAGVNAMGGVLGHAILNTICAMPLDKTVAALATGVGVTHGGIIAIGLVLAGGAICIRACYKQQEEHPMPVYNSFSLV